MIAKLHLFISNLRSVLIPSHVFIIILSIVAVLAYFNSDKIRQFYQTKIKTPQTEQFLEQLEKQIPSSIQKGAANSTPLIAKKESTSAYLTIEGVVKFTNTQRAQNNLPPLTVNSKLNQSALIKANDMFTHQYFEHDSPDGVGVDGLAKESGYNYILIGENLALGNFENDQELVQGWMDSPGHRANILNNRYQEIGVSVLKGTYQGKSTWMAVQHFGMPITACPQPNNNLNNQITVNNNTLNQLNAELSAQKTELESMDKHDPSYNQKVEAYNAKVNEYNILLEQTKNLVNEYNSQIAAFNSCAG